MSDYASQLVSEMVTELQPTDEEEIIAFGEACIRRALKRAAEVAETARLKGQCNDLEVAYNQGVSNAITAIRALGGV